MKRTYDFSEEQLAALESLSSKMKCSRTDVLMNGLRLVRIIAKDAAAGIETTVNGRQLVGPWSDLEPVQ